MNQHPTAVKTDSGYSTLFWTAFLLLCFIAAAVAVRRIVALIVLIPAPTAQMGALDAAFASRKILTLCHIVPALAFVLLVPAWFLRRVRSRPAIHRRVTYALLIIGVVVGVTALLLSLHPIGGINEATAAILYDCLFLFCLVRVWIMLHRRDAELGRTWMMRAIAVLLGIATTRPVMGVFFATESITHLHPQQFFGIAFWIGFTTTYIAGEAYIRSHPTDPLDPLAFSHPMESMAATKG